MPSLIHGSDPILDVLWGLVLHGYEDDFIGDEGFGNYYLFLNIDPTEWPNLFELTDVPYDPGVVPTHIAHYILHHSDLGILDYWEFSSQGDAQRQWDEIMDDYEAFSATLDEE